MAVNEKGKAGCERTTRSSYCAKHGKFLEKGVVFRGEVFWMGCPICEAKRKALEERQRQIAAAMQQKTHYERVFGEWVPPRFRGGFKAFRAAEDRQAAVVNSLRTYVAGFEEHLKTGRGFVFSGFPGTGKTHLGCAVLLSLWPKYVGAYVSFPAFSAAIKQSWGQPGDLSAEKGMMSALIRAPLAVIDEVGSSDGRFESDLLFRIIDAR